MSKKTKIVLFSIACALCFGLVYIFTYVPPIPKEQGILDSTLFLGKGEKQPLIVAFGGGGGGNDWSRDYLKVKRDSLNNKGYALLAIGYFNSNDAPASLDRISLDAIHDSFVSIAKNPKIDGSRIILMGGSRGGELALNLASKYKDFNGVIAMSASNVSFPALTWSSNTSAWSYKNKEVPYVPATLKTISPALKGDHYTAFSMMLEDKEAVKKAEIEVENINGPVLLLSGITDNQWPATEMSEQIVKRLEKNKFKYSFKHFKLNGGHIAPLDHFNLVYDYLDKNFQKEQ